MIVFFSSFFVSEQLGTAQEKIYEQQPFDIITLNEQNQNRVLKTLPLDLPDRRVPDEFPSGTIRIRLLNNPSEELDLAWSGIEGIELFEQRVLQEANRLIDAGRFDEAFEHLVFLQNNYSRTDGLRAAVDSLLFKEAAALYRERNLERAFLLLDELHQRNPGRQGVTTALSRVLDTLFRHRIDAKDFVDARRIYQITEDRYRSELADLLNSWRERLLAISEGILATARTHLAQGDLRQAHMASRSALEVWPDAPGVRQMMLETARRYPLLTVGVSQEYGDSAVRPMFNWASRRTSRLRIRRLFELSGVGPDGSEYICPIGQAEIAEDGRSFSIGVFDEGPSAAVFAGLSVSRRLLSLASPDSPAYDPAWARRCGDVSLEGLSQVNCSLRRPHLRVQALLSISVASGSSDPLLDLWQPYELADSSAAEQRFMLDESYAFARPTQPREIVERSFDNPQHATRALRRGDVDMLGRVFPADIAQLRQDASLIVRPYRIPSLHILVANPTRPYPANRIFRRGLAYAIDRSKILTRDLLGGFQIAGCRLLNGPFPLGIANDDPLAYANDPNLEPLPYDPRHARTLIQLAQIEIDAIAQKTKQASTSFTELTLAHPPSEIARVACGEMVEDLKLLGINCTLRVLSANETRPSDDAWDFLYVDYQMDEPLVDARRLLAYDGFARCNSPHLNLALRQLDNVVSWNDAGERLRVIHQLCYDDMSIIPLWQLCDYVAARRLVEGIVDEPVATYQDIEQWTLVPKE